MNKPLSILFGLGISCCSLKPLVAQEAPILPDTLPLPEESPPDAPTTPLPPTLEINPFQLPSGIDPRLDRSLVVTPEQFVFEGNTVFSNEQLQAEVAEFIGQPQTITDLLTVEEKITQRYAKEGYINSGANITLGQEIDPSNAVITIEIIEGRVTDIAIQGADRLESYIRDRIEPVTEGVLREQDLQDALRWLQVDPLIRGINAQLTPSAVVGQATLTLDVNPHKPFSLDVFANNNRAPSVGTFERGATATYRNVTGLGDSVDLTYRNTDGSNLVSVNYATPVNIQNGTVGLSFTYGDNNIVEEPFDLIDLNTSAFQLEASYRQPILRKISGNQIQEFALGVSLARLESNESLLGIPFPLTEGADGTGQTNSTVLRLTQDWNNRDRNDSIILRSQFNIGLPISTRNADLFGDGTFFAWRGQALWAHQFSKFTWVNRGGVQFADGPVIPSEQFSLGGVSTVRGYRQDGLTRDSGLFFSSELRVPLFSGSAGTLQLVPFIDVGHGFNQGQRFLPNPSQTLASVGLGLRYDLSERISARIDFGIPLLNQPDRRPTLQEEGLYLSITGRL